MDDIEAIENEITRSGKTVINISHWNASRLFYRQILSSETNHDFFVSSEAHDYIYSYYLDNPTKSSIQKRIGDESNIRECLITPSGTISIQCLLDFAKNYLSISDMVIINPSYFTVHHACKKLNINTQEIDIMRGGDNKFSVNRNKVSSILNNLKRKKKNYGLWLTNPIYSSGVSYSEEDIAYFKTLLRQDPKLHMFSDESFAYSSCELLRQFSDSKRFFSIHDPWKQLCLNGYKFSVITYFPEYQKHFEEWADILYGSLPASSIFGISLFTSEAFNNYKEAANNFYNERLKELDERYGEKEFFSFDKNTHGPYTSCYFSAKNFNLLSSVERFKPLIAKTGFSLIPNERNRFPAKAGFSFRINLAKYDGETFWNNFDYLWNYINNL